MPHFSGIVAGGVANQLLQLLLQDVACDAGDVTEQAATLALVGTPFFSAMATNLCLAISPLYGKDLPVTQASSVAEMKPALQVGHCKAGLPGSKSWQCCVVAAEQAAPNCAVA